MQISAGNMALLYIYRSQDLVHDGRFELSYRTDNRSSRFRWYGNWKIAKQRKQEKMNKFRTVAGGALVGTPGNIQVFPQLA